MGFFPHTVIQKDPPAFAVKGTFYAIVTSDMHDEYNIKRPHYKLRRRKDPKACNAPIRPCIAWHSTVEVFDIISREIVYNDHVEDIIKIHSVEESNIDVDEPRVYDSRPPTSGIENWLIVKDKNIITMIRHDGSVSNSVKKKKGKSRVPCKHGLRKFLEPHVTLEDVSIVNIKDHDGWVNTQDCFLYLCKHSFADIAQLLLENRAIHPDGESAMGLTHLMSATKWEHEGLVKTLLAAGADVNKADAQGCTSLMDCATSGCVEILKLLLKAGAHVNCTDMWGNSPLTLASCGEITLRHKEIVKLLLQKGAFPGQKDEYGMTALMYFERKGQDYSELDISL